MDSLRKLLPNTTIVGLTVYLAFSLSVNGLTVAKTPRKFDMFRHLSCRDELARVDNYSSVLATETDVLAVVIIYAGREDTRRGEVAAHLLSIRDRLLQNKSIDTARIILIDGGFREHKEIELYIVPMSARPLVQELAVPSPKREGGRLKKSVFTGDVYSCSKADDNAPFRKPLKRRRA